jgi:hypothetical protein
LQAACNAGPIEQHAIGRRGGGQGCNGAHQHHARQGLFATVGQFQCQGGGAVAGQGIVQALALLRSDLAEGQLDIGFRFQRIAPGLQQSRVMRVLVQLRQRLGGVDVQQRADGGIGLGLRFKTAGQQGLEVAHRRYVVIADEVIAQQGLVGIQVYLDHGLALGGGQVGGQVPEARRPH